MYGSARTGVLVAFDSISSSLLLREACRERAIDCAIIPVPRSVSSSCGYAAEVCVADPGVLTALLNQLGIVDFQIVE